MSPEATRTEPAVDQSGAASSRSDSRRNGYSALPAPRVGPRSESRDPTDLPWSQPRFWILQLVVLALYLVRLALTLSLHLDTTSLAVEFSTFVIFLGPVLFAALIYGFAGALATAAWVTVLAVPRVVAATTADESQAAWAEVVQIALLDFLAVFIGQRVSTERSARELADSEREAHLHAEALYRDLFDSNQAPILIVDPNGVVVETNAAAERAFLAVTTPPTSPRTSGRADRRPPDRHDRRRSGSPRAESAHRRTVPLRRRRRARLQ